MKHGTWIERPDGVIELTENKSPGGGGRPITPKEAITFLAMLALIITLIIGFVHCYNAAHSPKTINVNLANISTEYVPSKYSSSSGTRYLYLEFEVISKRHKVNEINLFLNISDTAGNNLGRLSVSLGSQYDRLELARGDKRSIINAWDDDRLYWGDEDIFNVLYHTDYSDLTFTYDIWRVVYANGYTWTQSLNNDQSSNSNDDSNAIDNDHSNTVDNDVISSNDTSDNGNVSDTLLDVVKDYAGSDVIFPDDYSDVIHHTPNCGWYSYADEEYHNTYYISFKIDEESTHDFVENFTNKLTGDGYALRYDEYHYEYVKDNTVICFSNILESQVDGRFEYYYMQYYAYSLN